MVDIWPAWKRSEVMARIKATGNLSTELKLRAILTAARLRGWRRHHPLPGRLDFVFYKIKVAIFADGDFWHGRFTRRPKTNKEYWLRKIEGNINAYGRANDIQCAAADGQASLPLRAR